MFHGSIPAPLRSIIHEHAGAWPDRDIYVGCSGNFTIERVLHARFDGRRSVHGNDVQAYSCALGWWLAGQPLPFTLRTEYEDVLDWLTPHLGTGTDSLATLMLGTRFLQWIGKQGLYYQRMITATRDQWASMHAKTVAKLQALSLRLGGFYAGDVRTFLADLVPADAPVVAFPPFFAGDYQAQFAAIDKCFDWPEPAYSELDEDGKEQIIGQVRDRPHWILGLHVQRDDLRRYLAGMVQTANRGVPIYVYAASGPRRIVRPRQPTAAIPLPKIGPGDEIGDRIVLHPLTFGQFCAIRSQFMSKTILPGQPSVTCGVSVDGLLIGAFAFNPPSYDPRCAYLLSDFPVSWSRYRRLAKLIVMAAISSEGQQLAQRAFNHRLTDWSTTAFSDNPNSAKYGRGIPGVVLQKRTEPANDGTHRYQLQYGGPFGAWSLREALATWKAKHGHVTR